MKAIGNKILTKVEKVEEPVEKAGTFIIPDANKTYETAKIISVGEEIKSDLKENDLVIIYKGAGAFINIDGEDFRIISISDILVKKD